MTRDEIANCIRKLHFEHGEMTQSELARRVGCTRQTIVLLEHGRYSPSLGLAFRVAQVFGKPLDEVFEYRGPRD